MTSRSPPAKRSQSPPTLNLPPPDAQAQEGKQLAAANAQKTKLARPPIRSNFDLEPNPFEQSFSSTSAVHSHSSIRTLASDPSRTRSLDSATSKALSLEDPNNAQADPNSSTTADGNKPVLPPLSSIVSPADHSYPSWAMGSSLRSGPLSPAMLTGPANQGSLGLGTFDSSFVRTGLTPDVTRTGLTPLIAGAGGYPPPTPNTAALLAIVNGTSGPSQLPSTAAITPNTLNAIHGVLGQSLAANGPTAVGLDPTRQNPNGQQYQPFQNDDFNTDPTMTNAASALYLLSQQSMRTSQGQVAPSAVSVNPNNNNNNNNVESTEMETDATGARRAAKRKSMDTPAAPAARGAKKAKGASNATTATRTNPRRRSTRGIEADDDDDEEDDDDGSYDGDMGLAQTNGRATNTKAGSKKPETEEEKRRNFLERNRQAALKCRQRKKKWLQDLQAKVEFLESENERLTNALITAREEIGRLSQLVVSHGGAPSALLNNPMELAIHPPQQPPNQQNNQHHHQHQHQHQQSMQTHSVSMSVSLPNVNKSIAAPVPLPNGIGVAGGVHQGQPMQAAIAAGRNYGY